MKHSGKIVTTKSAYSFLAVGLCWAAGLCLCWQAAVGYAQPSQKSGWITLIANGNGIENFESVGDANWRTEGDAIVADNGSGGFLVTKQSYKDFLLVAEFWADDNTNSGIYFRCAKADAITDTSCYEANIFDQRPEAKFGTGAIVHIAPITELHASGKRWNTLRITAIGSQLTVVLNDVQTANVRNTNLVKGPIALQYGTLPPNDARGGAIKWRKLEIKPL
jgi:hypothetical protein